ncbi:sn-glycerol-3-phosphate import ATP-binding protein UgpC [Photobacterium sp. GB-72]|uniref:sn-glycerol-3-phosphate import ATP-binding protein UgpC n=1 Tax=Photobacterium sp. GB-72 TaxID=2022105 RepID=UPI000D174649|nr:sn-glycerol-3-phosphate import ATP-binding protein UgpC [Photobacterium sp. GB-72]PSV30024.1 sn-glycerol-3-phosphate ABC transporter ATP-binding protein UgpC [Photobacterium sp. GB-72]
MSTLTLNKIAKSYPNGFKAIHELNLDISDGEMVVLVGPSGCGKSTLLRMIAGLEEISSGDLSIDTTRVNDLEPGERDIAMVFQNYALYPHMTVFNNMAYGLRNRKTPKHEIERLVNEAATMLELDHLLDRKPNQLSGGQRQRVAMGRAIVRHPKVFLFDEPLSNLDAKLRVQMRLEIKKLQRRLGTTSVYVTHDQVEAMTLADKLVVLNKGNVEQVGTPIEIYDNPASLFVATFIGSPSMNILDANMTSQGIELNGRVKSLSANSLEQKKVKLGLRPEHLQIDNEQPWFNVEVEFIEALGADLLLYCQTQEAQSQQLVLRVEGHSPIKMGDSLGVNIKPENIHLFDCDTSKRIPYDHFKQNEEVILGVVNG